MERALTAEQTPNDVFEVRLHNSMGQGTATLLLTATTCLAPTGQTSGVICIGQDITKLKEGAQGTCLNCNRDGNGTEIGRVELVELQFLLLLVRPLLLVAMHLLLVAMHLLLLVRHLLLVVTMFAIS